MTSESGFQLRIRAWGPNPNPNACERNEKRFEQRVIASFGTVVFGL